MRVRSGCTGCHVQLLIGMQANERDALSIGELHAPCDTAARKLRAMHRAVLPMCDGSSAVRRLVLSQACTCWTTTCREHCTARH